jgi:hypothetical protein
VDGEAPALSVSSDSLDHAWSVAAVAIAAAKEYGLVKVEIGESVWELGIGWDGESAADEAPVILTFTAASR